MQTEDDRVCAVMYGVGYYDALFGLPRDEILQAVKQELLEDQLPSWYKHDQNQIEVAGLEEEARRLMVGNNIGPLDFLDYKLLVKLEEKPGFDVNQPEVDEFLSGFTEYVGETGPYSEVLGEDFTNFARSAALNYIIINELLENYKEGKVTEYQYVMATARFVKAVGLERLLAISREENESNETPEQKAYWGLVSQQTHENYRQFLKILPVVDAVVGEDSSDVSRLIIHMRPNLFLLDNT